MRSRAVLSCLFLFPLASAALAEEDKLWTGNKLTAALPFPAKVIAVQPSWVGYTLLLQEIAGEARLCEVMISITGGLQYAAPGKKLDEKANAIFEAKQKEAHWTFLSPGVEVDRFSWSMGLVKLGRIFGEDDVLLKASRLKAP